MEKSTFIYFLIEGIIFLIPIAALFIKIGGYKKSLEDVVEKSKGLPEWKATMNEKVASLELNDIEQGKTLTSINENLIKISTQVQLLLDNKIKVKDE